MARELDRATLSQFILGGLAFRGDGSEDFLGLARRSLTWYKMLQGRGAGAVLFPLVHDVGHLLLKGRQFQFRTLYSYDEIPEGARDIRLSYENAFLNALLSDPYAMRARMAILRDETRDELIVRAIQCVLSPLMRAKDPGYTDPVRLNPQLLREFSIGGRVSPVEQALRLEESLGEPGFLERALRESLKKLLAKSAFLEDADLAEIEHWDAYLGREDLRMAGRRIAFHKGRIRPADRRRFPVIDERPDVDTEMPDAGTYPQGGFSELSTRGSPENLVPSELIYLGEGNLLDVSHEEIEQLRALHKGGPGTPTIVDLFAYRFLARELLYYMRESGQLKRVRRTVHFVVEPDPRVPGGSEGYQGLRWREPGLRLVKDRLIIIILGLAARVAGDLGIIFSGDSVRFEIHILAQNVAVRADAERDAQLLRVLLEHEVKKEKVAVAVEESFDLRETLERGRRVYGIAIQYKDLPPAGLTGTAPVPKGLTCTVLKLGGEASEPELPGVRGVHLPLDERFLDHIEDARDGLLGDITGSRRVR